ncbi:MAG TPA: DUF4097 family beta strand repeat-containing protein, partial [Gemmatimonadales bacterium]
MTALALAAFQGADTVNIDVERGDRIEVDNHEGSITVRAWNRNTVQLRAPRDAFTIERAGGQVSVEQDWDQGGPRSVALELSVPAWMALELSGVNTDITVTGAGAGVSAETVSGRITLEGGNGIIELVSVEGRVSVTGFTGKLEAVSVNEGVLVRRGSGSIQAESVNGDVTLLDIRSADVDAESVNGSITFSGPIQDNGRYQFATHNGGVTVGVQEGADAVVSVTTFQGSFAAGF